MYAQVEQAKAELKAQSDAAKNDLEREKMAVDNARKQLELEQKAVKDNAELALKEMKLQIEAMKAMDGSQVMKVDSVMKAINQLQNMAESGINQ
jgi:hypothetical protein